MDYTNDQLERQGIYAIVNNTTGRVYIGRAGVSFRRRWYAHRYYLNRGQHHNLPLQEDWNELGSDAFQFSIVQPFAERLSAVDLYDIETAYVRSAETWLYNVAYRKRDPGITSTRRKRSLSRTDADPSIALNLEEVVQLLDTTNANVRYWAREGRLPGVKIGREWRFSEDDVNTFAEEDRRRRQR